MGYCTNKPTLDIPGGFFPDSLGDGVSYFAHAINSPDVLTTPRHDDWG